MKRALLAVWLTLPARAGRLDGEVAADFLRAESRQTGEGGGRPEALAAQELGTRVRLRGRDLAGPLTLRVDWRGREPVGGDVDDDPRRLLYEAEVGYQLAARRVALGGGRILAPAVGLLVVDGARAELRAGRFALGSFLGRRAITSSMDPVAAGELLPAFGGALRYAGAAWSAEAAGGWTRDQVTLLSGTAGASAAAVGQADVREDLRSAYALARAAGRLGATVQAGGDLAFAQRAAYQLGPTWRTLDLDVRAIDFFSGAAWLDWRPRPALRLGYETAAADAAVFRSEDPGGRRLEPPGFWDHRARAAWRALERAWLRADARLRLRPDRHERRYGAALDVDRIAGGLYARGSYAYDDVRPEGPEPPDLDRSLWSASLGWRVRDRLDLEAGASFTERAADPVSARIGGATDAEDLSPFVLEAQKVAFARGFWWSRRWFAGLDVEVNVEDPGADEWRALAQVGALAERSW